MRCFFQYTALLLLLVFSITKGNAQEKVFRYYTIKDGLPSNSIYRCLQDKRGFLWIATENGVSRFDGIYFKNYSISDGLPDADVYDILIDSSQTIWVLPFGKSPAYYNTLTDRFENASTQPELAKIEHSSFFRANALRNGGVAFSNSVGDFFIYREGKTSGFKKIVNDMAFKIIDIEKNKWLLFYKDSIRIIEDGKKTGSFFFKFGNITSEVLNDIIYVADSNKITSYNFFTKEVCSLLLTFNVRGLNYTDKDLVVISKNGNAYTLDTKTLQIKDNILSNTTVNYVHNDNSNNTWICTKEEGLIKIAPKKIFTSFPYTLAQQQNFNCIATNSRTLLAGNNAGEIFYTHNFLKWDKLNLYPERDIDGWVRKIITLKKGFLTVTQNGCYFINNELKIKEPLAGFKNRGFKSAVKENDSIIYLGTHSLLMRLNVNNFVYTDSVVKRVTALTVSANGNVFVGSTEGLFKYSDNQLVSYAGIRKVFSYRISALAATKDVLWVGLGSDSIFAIRNEKIIGAWYLSNLFPGSTCKVLYAGNKNDVWVGTNKCLGHISYAFNNDSSLLIQSTYFTTNDGLSGEQVNDIVIEKDTLYAATSNGISYFPASLNLPVNDIPVYITSIGVGDKKNFAVKESYNLKYFQNNIRIEIAGVDFEGLPGIRYQYRVNDGGWINTNENFISFPELAPGNYRVEIKAIRRDGQPSEHSAGIAFHIATPFWKNILFWIVFASLTLIGVIWFVNQRQKLKQKRTLEKVTAEQKLTDLEMQALKAQINPHFVFNCLNSIKQMVYEKDFRSADKYLDNFSSLLRTTIEQSSVSLISLSQEVDYLQNYLELEKLRFDERFDYKIEMASEFDMDKTFIPSMLLQPFIENSIKHGIQPMYNKKGLVTIQFKKEEKFLICMVDDNGIGREASAMLQKKIGRESIGKGMEISQRRAWLFKVSINIEDKKNHSEEPDGTCIILRIPLDLLQ
ncbi:MAG TPA: histidine kinase [Chitinophagaceae bacterium]|nr:histidine kinase [Chitinophagaceae bacterium]